MPASRPLLTALSMLSCVAAAMGESVDVDAAGDMEPSASAGTPWGAAATDSAPMAGASSVDGNLCGGGTSPAAVEVLQPAFPACHAPARA